MMNYGANYGLLAGAGIFMIIFWIIILIDLILLGIWLWQKISKK